jgi:outer membrane receptor for ferrienterochelin and colicins
MRRIRIRRPCVALGVMVALLVPAGPVAAGPEQAADELFELSFSELLDVEVVVTTASRRPEKVRDIPASVVIVTREEIETYGYRTLDELLRNIPGLYMINDYSAQGLNFGVRGYLAGSLLVNVKILVNGTDQLFDVMGSPTLIFNPVPVAAIDRIEVIRGPTAVVYGSGAFFGVINIITNESGRSARGTRLQASVGNQETTELFARHTDREGEFGFTVNGSWSTTRGIDADYAVLAPDDVFTAHGVDPLGSTGGQLADDRLFVDLSGTLRGFRFAVTHGETERGAFVFGPQAATNGNLVTAKSTRATVGLAREVASGWRLDLQGGVASDTMDLEYRVPDRENPTIGVQTLSSDAWFFDGHFSGAVSEAVELSFGANLRTIRDPRIFLDLFTIPAPTVNNATFDTPEDESISTWGVFGRMDYQASPSVRLVAGLRLEQMLPYDIRGALGVGQPFETTLTGRYDSDELELFPQLALIWSPADGHLLKFLAGRSARRPSFFQARDNTLDPRRENLDPESITTYEIAYTGHLSDRVSLGLNLFHNQLTDLVTRVVLVDLDASTVESWSANAGEVSTQGIELTAQLRPTESLQLEASLTVQDSDEKGVDRAVPYSPETLGYLKVAWQPSDTFRVGLTGTWVGSMLPYYDEARPDGHGGFGARIGDEVEGSALVGANLRWVHGGSSGLFANLRASNLFDETIRFPTTTNNPWATYGTVDAGRTWLLTVGLDF